MKILFTGKGSSGSWQVRGEQLGSAIGATVKPMASVDDMRAHDVVVLVKRPNAELIDAIRASAKPLIWDIVDSWPQPEGNEWPAERCLAWLRTQIDYVKPDGLICATRDMLADAEFPKAMVIYHHGRPGYARSRHWEMRRLGYDGGPHYLGRYEYALASEVSRRKWLSLNSGHGSEGMCAMLTADVAICLRDCTGYAPRHWKSNQKLANAQALGIPALCSPESGYQETSTGGVLWIESPSDLPAAFEQLSDPSRYAELCAGVDEAPTLAGVAAEYLRFLETLI